MEADTTEAVYKEKMSGDGAVGKDKDRGDGAKLVHGKRAFPPEETARAKAPDTLCWSVEESGFHGREVRGEGAKSHNILWNFGLYSESGVTI